MMPPLYLFHSMDSIMPRCIAVLDEFHVVTKPELIKIIFSMRLFPLGSFLTKLLFSHLNAVIDLFRRIVNLSLTAGVFPTPCKTSIVQPLIKRPGLDPEVLKNYRPVSNLRFVSKIIEKIISVRLLDSCGTALLRVYNDIVTIIGKGNRSFLVLLDLSAAFDTIDLDTLFELLEKYVEITGNALQFIKSYFSGRTQRVVIAGILLNFASLICGVPQASILGRM